MQISHRLFEKILYTDNSFEKRREEICIREYICKKDFVPGYFYVESRV